MWKTISVTTGARVQFLDITAQVRAEVAQSGVKNGICYVFVPHTTAGITINENADPDVVRDLTVALARIVPEHGDYHHSEGNSDAHLKASFMGFHIAIPVIDGSLALGTWQGIYFCEFDGPRRRNMKVGVIGDKE